MYCISLEKEAIAEKLKNKSSGEIKYLEEMYCEFGGKRAIQCRYIYTKNGSQVSSDNFT